MTNEADTVKVGLLPCPHCGEATELYPCYHKVGDAKPFAIDCLGCGADFEPREGMDVIAAWNRRVPHEAEGKEDAETDFECEDCLGMGASHGCYCDAMGAEKPGGPLSTDAAMDRATQVRARGNLLLSTADRLEQEAHDRAIERGEHIGVDGI